MHWGEQTTDEMCLLGVQVVTENPADIGKIVSMRGNRLGAALMGGDTGKAGGRSMARVVGEFLDTEGFPIPERFKEQLGRFDTNNDGNLTTNEIDAMPEVPRNRIRAALRQRLGLDEEKSKNNP